MLWSYWLTIHKLIQFSDSFCILPHKVTFPIHQAPYCPISNEMNLFPQTSFHRKTILFHLKILLLARLQCLLFTCNSHNVDQRISVFKKEHAIFRSFCIVVSSKNALLIWKSTFTGFQSGSKKLHLQCKLKTGKNVEWWKLKPGWNMQEVGAGNGQMTSSVPRKKWKLWDII